jgi:diguanylate cyclase (GGDEF)-like protein
VLGVLNTQSARENAFGERDLHVLRILGTQLGVALHNAQVRAQLELVQEIGIRLVTIRKTGELFPSIVRQIRERLHHDSCAILLADGDRLVLEVVTGEFPTDLVGLRIPIGEGVTGVCALEKRCVNVGDVRRHPAYIPSGIADARSEIASPILFEGGLLGVLTIESKTENAFDDDDARLLSILSAQVAVGIHNARLYDAVEEMAVTDALTGLHNYRYFYDRLVGEMSRASRYLRPLSLIMIDLDDFKEVNDRHGHLKGDEVLREVARTLRSNIRRYDNAAIMKETEIDIASRYGGEEFIIILPETEAEGAAIAAERLRKALESDVAERAGLSADGGPPRRITGSLGVTAFRKGENPEALIKRTDEAVYEAKRGGKNRVVLVK